MLIYPANSGISGYADGTGNKKRNQDLYERRADAVKNHLISKGISSSNLTAKGVVENMPIASNNAIAGRAKNRRVEVKLAK